MKIKIRITEKKAWLYSIFLIAMVVFIAVMVFTHSRAEEWRDANLPLIIQLQK